MAHNNRIIPSIQYQNVKAAIPWLCTAFGFEKHAVYDEEGKIVHAQLVYQGNMIMVGPINRVSPYTKLIKRPIDIGGFVTQSSYIIVDDVEAHHQHATQNGAKIAIELKDEGYRGKMYSCFDLEGHLWNFGSYSPWE